MQETNSFSFRNMFIAMKLGTGVQDWIDASA